MNQQEIFDTVALHLLTQGEQSTGGTVDGCAYRGDEGRKCAVGCLIPDDLYDPIIENKTIIAEEVHEILKKLQLTAGNKMRLLGDLQSLHDADNSEYSWEESLLKLARDYKLDPAVVINFTNSQANVPLLPTH